MTADELMQAMITPAKLADIIRTCSPHFRPPVKTLQEVAAEVKALLADGELRTVLLVAASAERARLELLELVRHLGDATMTLHLARRQLRWPNGSAVHVHSVREPDRMRGMRPSAIYVSSGAAHSRLVPEDTYVRDVITALRWAPGADVPLHFYQERVSGWSVSVVHVDDVRPTRDGLLERMDAKRCREGQERGHCEHERCRGVEDALAVAAQMNREGRCLKCGEKVGRGGKWATCHRC